MYLSDPRVLPVLFIIFSAQCLNAQGCDEYTDDMARMKFFPLASAAYSSFPQRCIENKYGNATLATYYSGECDPDPSDSCAGFTAVLHDDEALVLSFRGTARFMQLVEEADLSTLHRKVSSQENGHLSKINFDSANSTHQTRWIAGGYVSTYFYKAFMAVWNGGLKESFKNLHAKYPSYFVWVTGHSLGGALASLAASYIIAEENINGSNVSYSYRVVHWRDLVPHIPMKGFEGYWHHNSEVFYPYNMEKGSNFTICQADESRHCSDGLLYDLSVYDHLHYFNKDVSKYGEDGCIDVDVTPPSSNV
ncbi:triacylglycerol lipase [Ancylostoma ceylanicum]|uniref:Triacylglycerol lipase n=1 Tax=Ancylostoma ceylanicum TaxID=53326 RepID=A0A0D6L535_9BILA|nr:triacylglycerol lipase [Ancylostoma ceylanicum]